jgi:N-acetylglucosamine-6-phosphate deacetylase
MKGSELIDNRPGNSGYAEGIHYETGKRISIEFSQGVITSVLEKSHGKGDGVPYIAPGLIDNQVNGYRGIDFSREDLTIQGIRKAAGAMLSDGVTTFLPVVVTGNKEGMTKNLRVIAEAIAAEGLQNIIPGIHLEGPWLSTESGFYGCHPFNYLRKPSIAEFDEFQEAACGKIIELTIAPELDGAMELIKYCSEKGIKVALGHTNASAAIINEAVICGARISTHLGNGCANLIDRHRNPLWPQLANDLLTPSIIADGHHLLPEELTVFSKAKGFDNLILTSDVNFLIGMQPGVYDYMGSKIEMSPDGLVRVPELNCLAGASMPLKRGIEIMMRDTGCSLGQALNMATRNVARVMDLHDRGSLEPGKKADFFMFELSDGLITIKHVYLNGVN